MSVVTSKHKSKIVIIFDFSVARFADFLYHSTDCFSPDWIFQVHVKTGYFKIRSDSFGEYGLVCYGMG